jgi:hypothetical protein
LKARLVLKGEESMRIEAMKANHAVNTLGFKELHHVLIQRSTCN